ncbi:MAG: hypothetical protein CMJ72_04775 [Planctomycetaceae bacterium]|nr:hypothetical protein [Planctomycetaceae bacterium]
MGAGFSSHRNDRSKIKGCERWRGRVLMKDRAPERHPASTSDNHSYVRFSAVITAEKSPCQEIGSWVATQEFSRTAH